jgi:hypothetical protein
MPLDQRADEPLVATGVDRELRPVSRAAGLVAAGGERHGDREGEQREGEGADGSHGERSSRVRVA